MSEPKNGKRPARGAKDKSPANRASGQNVMQDPGKETLLVVDDDKEIVKQIRWALGEEYEVCSANDGASALQTFRRVKPAIVLLDLGLPPHPRKATEGLKTLEGILREEPLTKVIIVSGNAERENALRAVERGAYDVFPKPIDLDELRVVLNRVRKRLDLERAGRKAAEKASFEDILGKSPPMQAVFATIRKVAPADVPVLVTGESGTGKELVAQAIHALSSRKDGPFVPIHCAAIPENLLESELFGHEKGSFTGASERRKGKIEYAQGGTLFLDEIGELVPSLQVKLLRFLQERVLERIGGREAISVDTRVVAATNRDLAQEVREGRFREDLFFRLAVVQVELPPLRNRGEDIVELAEHFAHVYAKEFGKPAKPLSPAAAEALRSYKWPGNVRELQNRMKRAVVLADGPAIAAEELELTDDSLRPREALPSLKEARESLERDLVVRALRASGGNVSQAARALGVSRPTLYELIAKFDLERNPPT